MLALDVATLRGANCKEMNQVETKTISSNGTVRVKPYDSERIINENRSANVPLPLDQA
jgi:hypothetical protein